MIGKTISHYRILEKLGEGGMGVVYKAEDTKLDRTVALKFLTQQAVASDEKARFVHEAKSAAALSHSNICHVYEIDEFEGRSFIAMELVDGESLKQRIDRGPLKLDEALYAAIQIAEGLQKAHEKGIVHRDIKPANVMVSPEGQCKIMDFGLAKSAARTTMTKDGTTLGTFAYMSPEQTRGEAVDGRTDIWSLGVVLHEMLAGQRPFRGDYEQAVVYSILNAAPEPVTTIRTEVPTELERIVDKCLGKEVAERYQTAADFVADCRRVLYDMSGTSSSTSAATSSGDRPAASPPPPAKTKPRRIAVAVAGGMLLLVILSFVFNFGGLRDWLSGGVGPASQVRIESLAVLPFLNTGSDPDMEYLCDEIPASIMNNLSRLPDLRVVPRSTVFRFRGREGDLIALGRELNVGAVLTGEIGIRAGKVNVRVELVDIADDRQLWGDRYTRSLTDIIELETRIAEEISGALRPQLTGKQRASIAEHATDNPVAHRLYLKGRHFWNKRTEEGTLKALDFFQQAVNEDPTFALAYAGLADSYSLLVAFGLSSPREAFPKARAAAIRAIEINDGLAEAHTSLAFIKESYDWDWSGADREYRRAIELDSGYATAYQWYSFALFREGRWDDAISAAKRAQELDPLSLPISGCLGYLYYLSRQYDEAIEQTRKALELDPSFPMVHAFLGIMHVQRGEYEKGVEELELSARLSERDPEYLAYLGYGYAVAGRSAEARAVLDELRDRADRRYVPPSYFAMIHSGLGEPDEAFGWFDRAYEVRDYYLNYQLLEPMYDHVRNDPRFDELMRRVGLDRSILENLPTEVPHSGKIILAVLPFDNLSPDPDQEYFCDGMTDEMISHLGRLRPDQLGVIARTTAMRYKNTEKRIGQIGAELGADYVLEGSVRKAGRKIRISASLVQVRDETQIFSDAFENELSDVFAVQNEVAQGIAEALALELLPEKQARLDQSQTIDTDAYEAYLKGRYHWNKRTKEDLEKSTEYFKQATEVAPDYAVAYASLAESYTVMGMWGFMRSDDAEIQSERYAKKAIAIDDKLGSAYTVLAAVAWSRWEWAESERLNKIAIRLDPNYATAHQWYAELLSDVERHDEALAEMHRALELDPLSLVANASMGALYYYARRYDDAIDQCNKALSLQDDFWMAHFYLWQVYTKKQMYDEAVEHFKMALADDEAAELAAAYEDSGIEGVYRWMIQRGDELTYQTYNRPYLFAIAHALLGENDHALVWLEKAFEAGSGFFCRAPEDPAFDGLRSDPRFTQLFEEVGLEK
jgi:serine/threonine-protein kinase